VEHLTKVIGSTPVRLLYIDDASWGSYYKRLRRTGASFARIPAPRGRIVVLGTFQGGKRVADAAVTVRRLIEKDPRDGRKRTASRDWDLSGRSPQFKVVGPADIDVWAAKVWADTLGIDVRVGVGGGTLSLLAPTGDALGAFMAAIDSSSCAYEGFSRLDEA
jgi:hypothetical protein